MHQETHAGWHHHRLCLWPGLHAAGRCCIPDTRLEKITAGYLCPRLPAHLLYMVGDSLDIKSPVYSYISWISVPFSPLISGTLLQFSPLFLTLVYLLSGWFLSLPDGCWPTTGERKPSRSSARQLLLTAAFYLRQYRCVSLHLTPHFNALWAI